MAGILAGMRAALAGRGLYAAAMAGRRQHGSEGDHRRAARQPRHRRRRSSSASLITGSASMLAESIHSVADSGNQGLLLLGGKRAQRAADRAHPFGYGRERYFWAFVVAHGAVQPRRRVRHLRGHREDPPPARARVGRGRDRHPAASPSCSRAFSFRTAVARGQPGPGRRRLVAVHPPVARTRSCRSCCSRTSAPWSASSLALGGVGVALATDDAVWDGYGTLSHRRPAHGIAVILAVEMKSLLIGESADRRRGGRHPRGHRDRARRRAPHPPAHPAPRPRRAARRRQGRASSATSPSPSWPRPSTGSRAASAGACPTAGIMYIEPDMCSAVETVRPATRADERPAPEQPTPSASSSGPSASRPSSRCASSPRAPTCRTPTFARSSAGCTSRRCGCSRPSPAPSTSRPSRCSQQAGLLEATTTATTPPPPPSGRGGGEGRPPAQRRPAGRALLSRLPAASSTTTRRRRRSRETEHAKTRRAAPWGEGRRSSQQIPEGIRRQQGRSPATWVRRPWWQP